jgi:hypothetical protein
MKFNKAKEHGYLVCKGSQRPFYNRWYQWCKVHEHPFVVAHTKVKYADVTLDCWPTPFDLNERGQKKLTNIFHQYIPELKGGSTLAVGKTYSWISGLPIERSQAVAEAILEVWRDRENLEPI